MPKSPPLPTADPAIRDRLCLVTGATAGIGRVTAEALAAGGARVILAGRSLAKLEAACQEIRQATGSQHIDYLQADFSDLEQVRGMAAAFRQRYDHLDVLVNNAGAYFNRRQLTSLGVERTFLVNHLAPFLLTLLLLDRLQASGPARIVNVASDAHHYGTLDLDDLGFRRGYFGMKAYARSKLANILFTYELARRLPSGGPLVVNALHPGHIVTDIYRTSFPGVGPLVKAFMGLFLLPPEAGADNSVYLASSPEVAGVTGKYFVQREAVPSAPLSYATALAARLWQDSEKLVGLA